LKRCFCPLHGDLTERLKLRPDAEHCPKCGAQLTWFDYHAASEAFYAHRSGVIELAKKNGKNGKNDKKLKVMHIETKHAQEVTAKPEIEKIKKVKESKNGALLEKMIEVLGKLGGEATSPEIVKELGWEPEGGRQKVRSLMDRLHAEHKIHRTREGKVYHFKLAEQPKPEAKVEVAA